MVWGVGEGLAAIAGLQGKPWGGEVLQPGCSQSAQVGGVPAWVRLSTTQKVSKNCQTIAYLSKILEPVVKLSLKNILLGHLPHLCYVSLDDTS